MKKWQVITLIILLIATSLDIRIHGGVWWNRFLFILFFLPFGIKFVHWLKKYFDNKMEELFKKLTL